MKRNTNRAGNDYPGCSMPVGYAEGRNIVFPELPRRSDHVAMKTSGNTANNMSGRIAINQHQVTSRTKPAVVQPSAPGLIAEWQQRGPETLSGYALRKLRLAMAPSQPVTTAKVAA